MLPRNWVQSLPEYYIGRRRFFAPVAPCRSIIEGNKIRPFRFFQRGRTMKDQNRARSLRTMLNSTGHFKTNDRRSYDWWNRLFLPSTVLDSFFSLRYKLENTLNSHVVHSARYTPDCYTSVRTNKKKHTINHYPYLHDLCTSRTESTSEFKQIRPSPPIKSSWEAPAIIIAQIYLPSLAPGFDISIRYVSIPLDILTNQLEHPDEHAHKIKVLSMSHHVHLADK